MIDSPWDRGRERMDGSLGTLTAEVAVHVLNGSAAGCLLECSRAIEVGTIAALSATLVGRQYADQVEVVRCQKIAGAGTWQIAVRFLPTRPDAGSLRHAIHREIGQLAARLRAVSIN